MRTIIKIFLLPVLLFMALHAGAVSLLIPMDDMQKDHLKSYGIAYWVLEQDIEVKWLLNYRGGSFLMQHYPEIENECVIRGVSFEVISDTQASGILNEIA